MNILRAGFKPGFKFTFQLTGQLIILIFALGSTAVYAEHEGERLDRVKAAIVLNIARFVTWPAEVFDADNKHLVLCYYRSKVFSEGLDSITGRTVAGRPLQVRKIERLSAARSCQILVISAQELDSFAEDTDLDPAQPLLTIMDQTHAAAGTAVPKGVLVSLVRQGSRIGFEVDLASSRSAGLKMSSQMLKHARIVGEGAE